ncbi:unnamed protein product [Meloidogyne enterolobii]|uniref:Uncharacterized protein n=1 Tax=Meloidogyne enterolobii TaxID=390850 RepID=A0ACB1AYR0_MELEN
MFVCLSKPYSPFQTIFSFFQLSPTPKLFFYFLLSRKCIYLFITFYIAPLPYPFTNFLAFFSVRTYLLQLVVFFCFLSVCLLSDFYYYYFHLFVYKKYKKYTHYFRLFLFIYFYCLIP